ncbi:hypothetical protein D6C90_00075 [Aureobasidium pullulans]|uniref:DUF7896 domain-containing protein n=1 Tax=Aureobasidium pullulans TaxID=5580 RepID=A0A4S9VS50_AURPU|nr:hypothetical protein D6C90_00075 [Aureobasidium pullulans]
MSQGHINPGYYNTYTGDVVYTNAMDNSAPANDQHVYTAPQSWSHVPMTTAPPLPTEAQWPLQYHPRQGAWFEQETLSPSDVNSEASGFDDSATPSLHRSDSGDFSEVWDHEPLSMPFSPFQPPVSTSGLLNSIGSGFLSLQLPHCVNDNQEESLQQFEYMLGDLEVNDPISSPAVSDATPHVAMHDSPHSEHEHEQQPCPLQPHNLSLSGRPRRTRQSREAEAGSSRRPARVNSTRARLFCEACRDSKDYSRGFRGEHELARHYAQKHTKHKKVWKCFDLSPDLLMRNCERCKTGHQYGTSYGGAEHFRRKHTAMFGKDMMELLRGKNQRWALSSNRLIEEGWLRQVFVPGDGEPSAQQEEQIMTTIHAPVPFLGDSQEIRRGSEMRMAHLQPFHQPQFAMHGVNPAWGQHQYQPQPQPYHQQSQQGQQHQHQHQYQHHHQQQQWHSG